MSSYVDYLADEVQAGDFSAFHGLGGEFVSVHAAGGYFGFFVSFGAGGSDLPGMGQLLQLGQGGVISCGLRVVIEPAGGKAGG